MNSKTLFNTNYAKQTLKRHKGILLLMIIIIPLITALLLSFMVIEDFGDFEDSYSRIILVNGFGMIGIPFILSNLFLNYAFSKKKVDFVNSMPISRKKIFLTNVLLGIGYIIALQLFNLIVLTIFMNVSKIYMTFSMIFDLCLIFTIGYSFMYAIYCLALSLSGTIYMQIVLSLLILFLIPFTRFFVFNSMELYDDGVIFYVPNNITCRLRPVDYDNMFLTVPFRLVMFNSGEIYSAYDAKDMLITTALTVLYIILGMRFFERRKMETAEEAITSNKLHLFVKGLTLLPMVTLFYYLIFEEEPNGAIILGILGAGVIFAYYLIYDLITRKKIKLKSSIIAFICSFVILFLFAAAGDKIAEKIEDMDHEIDYYDIESISMIDSNLFYSCRERLGSIKPLSDEDAMKLVNNLRDASGYYSRYSNSTNREALIIKLHNGRTYYVFAYVDEEVDKDLRNRLANDEEYIDSLYNILAINDNNYIEIVNDDSPMIDVEKDPLANDLNSNLKELLKEKIANGSEQDVLYSIYKYENHACITVDLPRVYGVKSTDIIGKYLNEKGTKFLREHQDYNHKYYSITLHKEGEMLDKDLYDDDRLDNNDELLNYFKQQINYEVDSNKEMYIIQSRVNYGPDFDSTVLVFYTNNIDAINKIISKDVDVNKDFYYRDEEIDYDYYYELEENADLENDFMDEEEIEYDEVETIENTSPVQVSNEINDNTTVSTNTVTNTTDSNTNTSNLYVH